MLRIDLLTAKEVHQLEDANLKEDFIQQFKKANFSKMKSGLLKYVFVNLIDDKVEYLKQLLPENLTYHKFYFPTAITKGEIEIVKIFIENHVEDIDYTCKDTKSLEMIKYLKKIRRLKFSSSYGEFVIDNDLQDIFLYMFEINGEQQNILLFTKVLKKSRFDLLNLLISKGFIENSIKNLSYSYHINLDMLSDEILDFLFEIDFFDNAKVKPNFSSERVLNIFIFKNALKILNPIDIDYFSKNFEMLKNYQHFYDFPKMLENEKSVWGQIFLYASCDEVFLSTNDVWSMITAFLQIEMENVDNSMIKSILTKHLNKEDSQVLTKLYDDLV